MLAVSPNTNQTLPGDVLEWARAKKIDAQQLDCMTAVMLKILDGKCQMRSETQQVFIGVYRVLEKTESQVFSHSIHEFIEKAFDSPDSVSSTEVHNLRLFAESAIEKSVMKAFKKSYSFLMPA